MAYVNTSRAALARPSLIGDVVEALRNAISRRKLYVRTLEELRTLSDRELADLGLSRSTIVDVAREAAYGK